MQPRPSASASTSQTRVDSSVADSSADAHADARTRFSNRVADYVKYRPSYPSEILSRIERVAALPDKASIADVGSGTGISAAWLLSGGYDVFAVEPNASMRAAAEQELGSKSGFHSIAGSADATTLPDSSVDMVMCAQSFHWFEPAAARREFSRILRGRKFVALMWNDRQLGGTPFLDGYEAVLRDLGTDYTQVNHHNLNSSDTRFREFFSGPYWTFMAPNDQQLNEAALLGRAFSSSYTPAEGDPRRQLMTNALSKLFHDTARSGHVTMTYQTQVFVGSVQ